MADASTAYASPASTAGRAAKAKAGSTWGPMPGAWRWIMNGMTLMPAPIIEQTPVATRPSSPISRARPDLGGAAGVSARGALISWRFCITPGRPPSPHPLPRWGGEGFEAARASRALLNFGGLGGGALAGAP